MRRQEGTALYEAYMLSPARMKPATPVPTPDPVPSNEFNDYVSKLHERKHAAYGDSWKKRGEVFSILPNIARKVDRLGTTDEDETATDTAIDLLVYLLKYGIWLDNGLLQYDEVGTVTRALGLLNPTIMGNDAMSEAEQYLRNALGQLEKMVLEQDDGVVTAAKQDLVASMIAVANGYARRLFWVQGNKTRSWNPEPAEDDETGKGVN
jgi:hypothetical protein